jgi:hypothetical protein
VVAGTPLADMATFVQQDQPRDCVVAATTMQLASQGITVSQDALAASFQASGVYNPNVGSNVQFVAGAINALAQSNGWAVQAQTTQIQNIRSLKAVLATSDQPVMFVNTADLYGPDDGDSALAVFVTGVVRRRHRLYVVFNDPSRPDGAGTMVLATRFFAAAADFDCQAVTLR